MKINIDKINIDRIVNVAQEFKSIRADTKDLAEFANRLKRYAADLSQDAEALLERIDNFIKPPKKGVRDE